MELTREKIMAAENRELDWMVSELMGYWDIHYCESWPRYVVVKKTQYSTYSPIVQFSCSRDECIDVLCRLTQIGLTKEYMRELIGLIRDDDSKSGMDDLWLIHTAPPDAICRAALLASLKEGE